MLFGRGSKKIVILLICVFSLTLAISGCGSDDTATSEETETTEATEDTQATEETETTEAVEVESAADFYDGKTIEFICPYPPGKGYDQYSRLLAPYLEKYTGATVVVRNVEGGGGMRGVNELYRAPADGLVIGIQNGMASVTNALAGIEGVVYELDKFSWIGRVTTNPRVFITKVGGPYGTIEDVINSQDTVRIGATGLGGSTYVDAVVVTEALGLKAEVIHGYDSSGPVEQAIARGDVDAMWGSWSSRRDFVEAGEAQVILQSGEERLSDLPDVPTWFDVADTPRAKEILTVQEGLHAVGRPVAGPPGIPPERLQFLREAFKNAMEDPDLIADAEEAQRPLNYASAEKIEEIAVGVSQMKPDIEEIFVKAIKGDI